MHFAVERDIPGSPREQVARGVKLCFVAGDYYGICGLCVKNADERSGEKDQEKNYDTQ
jgi:hypothetical protein